MGHQGLICRSCNRESSLLEIRETSEGESDGPVCPVCGSRSFGI
jgi:DNA-directed RNA polymerase subunit RPC12/RpoP